MSTKSFPFTTNKVKTVNYNYNRGVFFDEKKKRFVDFDDMDQLTYENYNQPFLTVKKYFYKICQKFIFYFSIVPSGSLRLPQRIPRHRSLQNRPDLPAAYDAHENRRNGQNVRAIQR
jgi:hypothetical protein